MTEFEVALRAAMAAYPNQRTGQVIFNAVSVAGGPGTFYIEDEKLCAVLRTYAEAALA